MPTIPSYNSQRNITTRQAAPFRNEAAQSLQGYQNVLGTLQDINQKWSQANDIMQYQEARKKYESASADIQIRAASDPNYRNSENYIKELDKAKKDSLAGIDNQQVANHAAFEFDHHNLITGIKMNAGFKEKQMDEYKYNLENNIRSLYSKKSNALTDVERQSLSHEINDSLNTGVYSGLITQEDADKLKKKSEIDAVQNLIYINPQEGVKQIENGNFDLTPEEKGKMINEAHQIAKRNKEFEDWQLKQAQTQSTISLSDALYNNNLTPTMVRDMQQKGLIDSETAAIFDSLAINKKYDIPESTSLGQPEYFLRLLDASHGDKTQIGKVLKDAATAYGDGKIGVNQYRYFIQSAKETFERQSKGIYSKTDEQNNFKASVDGIKTFFKGMKSVGEERDKAQTDFDNAINTFTDRYKPGESQKAMDSTLNDYRLKVMPEMKNFDAVKGTVIQDKNGNKALAFPDGHVEEIK